MLKPYRDHLRSGKDLVTTYEAVRAGFVALAIEKNRRATPFVTEARALKSAASRAKSPNDLLGMPEIGSGLLTAAGISAKASGHLDDKSKIEAILGLIRKFLEPAGANFVEELVFRFLLTKGDTLGGSMRNVGGYLAQCKLTRSIVAALRLRGAAYRWLSSDTGKWADMPDEDTEIEFKVRGLAWGEGSKSRTLMYNLTVPFVGNNVDICLFNCSSIDAGRKTYADPASYIALGELKGGIDPAGADEHWKTARTALSRIEKAFTKRKLEPKLFFVGAAIATNMAEEIWQMLGRGDLDNAANLTDDNQIASITRWLCGL